ncbi:MAG: hypothetical protein IT350_06495 [Deltaproteobacteria bacterium]|nr:hypothetical protein [Deltaproteobacteria bacterium]
MIKYPWRRLLTVVATVLALTVLSAACGDDDDDSDEGDNDEECVAYDECTQSPALSDELSLMAFEVDPEPECAAFGLDLEVLEVRATESRGRIEVRFRVNETNGNTIYTLTVASGPGTAYEDREFCFHEISGDSTYVFVRNFTECPRSMSIPFWSETSQWECPDSYESAETCRYSFDVLPWPPEGLCIEDPQ